MSTSLRSKRVASPPGSSKARRTAYSVASLYVLSAVLFNPWVGRLWRGKEVLDYRDVMSAYLFWSLGLAAAVASAGWLAGRARSQTAAGVTLLLISVASIVLLDRLLLVAIGLPLWVPDPVLTYRHRPNAVRSWRHSGEAGQIIRINALGHRDDPFPESKPEGEVRILVVGDSIAMGHGVSGEETFSNQLETMLGEDRSSGIQVINTGVQGYGLRQERVVLTESMRFSPDHVFVAVCMNDLQLAAEAPEETGLGKVDYHRVAPMPSRLLSYLLNETGFGRVVLELRLRRKSPAEERQLQLEALREMVARPRQHPLHRSSWDRVLSQVDAMAAVARSHEVGLTVLLFPYQFQLWDRHLQYPQRIFAEHAAERGIDLIDFTPVFEELLAREAAARPALHRETEDKRRQERSWTYYLDANHLTPAGHRVVAEALLDHLQK